MELVCCLALLLQPSSKSPSNAYIALPLEVSFPYFLLPHDMVLCQVLAEGAFLLPGLRCSNCTETGQGEDQCQPGPGPTSVFVLILRDEKVHPRF